MCGDLKTISSKSVRVGGRAASRATAGGRAEGGNEGGTGGRRAKRNGRGGGRGRTSPHRSRDPSGGGARGAAPPIKVMNPATPAAIPSRGPAAGRMAARRPTKGLCADRCFAKYSFTFTELYERIVIMPPCNRYLYILSADSGFENAISRHYWEKPLSRAIVLNRSVRSCGFLY